MSLENLLRIRPKIETKICNGRVDPASNTGSRCGRGGDRMKVKAIRTGRHSDWNLYKKLRNKVNNRKTKQAKEIIYNNLDLSISYFQKNDKRKFWQVVRHFVKNNDPLPLSRHYVFTLPSDEIKFYFSDEENAECLNDHFASVSNGFRLQKEGDNKN